MFGWFCNWIMISYSLFLQFDLFVISMHWKKDPLNESLSMKWKVEITNVSDLPPPFVACFGIWTQDSKGTHRLCLLLQPREHAEGKKLSHLLLHKAFQCHLWSFSFLYQSWMWLVLCFPYPHQWCLSHWAPGEPLVSILGQGIRTGLLETWFCGEPQPRWHSRSGPAWGSFPPWTRACGGKQCISPSGLSGLQLNLEGRQLWESQELGRASLGWDALGLVLRPGTCILQRWCHNLDVRKGWSLILSRSCRRLWAGCLFSFHELSDTQDIEGSLVLLGLSPRCFLHMQREVGGGKEEKPLCPSAPPDRLHKEEDLPQMTGILSDGLSLFLRWGP